ILPASPSTTIVKALRRQLAVGGLHDTRIRIAVRWVERTLSQHIHGPTFAVGLGLDAVGHAAIGEPFRDQEPRLVAAVAGWLGRSVARRKVRGNWCLRG